MNRIRSTAPAAVLGLVLFACADTGGRPVASPGTEEPSPAEAPVRVRVTNQNWSRMAVYAIVDGTRVRLGEVETGASLAMVMPPAATRAGEVELLADPLASDDVFLTGPLLIGPGDVVELVIENNLPLSHVRVW